MVIVHVEAVRTDFDGTVIDIETSGEFRREYTDSRQYRDHTPVVFGHINKNELRVCCIRREESIGELKSVVSQVIPDLKRPFYAFNCCFERGVLFHSLGIAVDFDGELNEDKYEWKGNARASLGIENYDDPFSDVGKKCMEAWERGEYNLTMRHNRSCLLKERDILLRRGYRMPDNLVLHGYA